MKSTATRTVIVRKVSETHSEVVDDRLVAEEPLEIRICYEKLGQRVERAVSVTMRTPGEDSDLAVGFLYSEGIISSLTDVKEINADHDAEGKPISGDVIHVGLHPGVRVDTGKLERHFFVSSSCGVCGKAALESVFVVAEPFADQTRPVVSASWIHTLPGRIRSEQELFSSTGGLHAAGLFEAGGPLLGVWEDIGRHNAVDKLIGSCFQRGSLPLWNRVMAVSGRGGFEIIQKALVARIPVIVAVGAPSSLAVELANSFGLTLIGFARNGRFNIYSAPQRVVDLPSSSVGQEGSANPV